MAKYKRLLVALAVLLVNGLPLGMAKLASAQAVVQSYASDTSLQQGMIIQLDTKDSKKVAPATQSDSDRIHGVVVAPNDAPLSLRSSANSQQYYVATDGPYQVLVSDQGGAIHKGDYVTLSALAGVGMKASSAQKIVLGKALNDFDGTSNAQSTTTVKEGDKNVIVHLGKVGIDISLSHNPLYQPPVKDAVQSFLQKMAQSVAHKQVSLTHIYVSIVVLLASLVLSGVLLYTGVRSSIMAMGRNPLARSRVLVALVQSILVGLVVFLAGMFAVYLLLKL
jgi:hypothetical protein